MGGNILFSIFIFLLAACIVVPLASRFRLGSVLGFILAGILIGPFGIGFIQNSVDIMHFAEFGVIMMLFLIGLELEPATLWKLRKTIIGLGGLQVLITSAAFYFIGISLGLSWQISLAVGMALSLSSTALVLQILQEKNLMQTYIGQTSFAVLLFQDLAVIPILIIIPLIAATDTNIIDHESLISGYSGWLKLAIVSVVILFFVFAGRYLTGPLFRFIAKANLREIFTATSLMLVVGITLIMQLVGVSPALGAFIAGVILANSEYKHSLETDIEPFKGLLLGLFFISVGLGINFTIISLDFSKVLIIVAVIALVKLIILFALGKLFKMQTEHNIGYSFALAQGGEFAFVLFKFAGSYAIISSDMVEVLTASVALSLIITPLLMLYYTKYVTPKFMSELPKVEYDNFKEKNTVILAGFGRFGQVIGRFLGAQGVTVTVLEKDPDQVEALRKFGYQGYFGDSSRADILRSAGAHKAKAIIITVDDADHCLDIVNVVKANFPNLEIFARARNRRHAYELHKLGVKHFKRELFESSLSMAKDVMEFLGFERKDMKEKAKKFRAHDEAALKKSFEFFDDESKMVSFSRRTNGELERLLQEDKKI